MQIIDKIKESNLEDKDSIIDKVNKLVESGIDDRLAFKQVLGELKKEVEDNLEIIYKQLE